MTPRLIAYDLVSHLLREVDGNPGVVPSQKKLTEPREIWLRLVFCILSSQVKISTARAATRMLDESVDFFSQSMNPEKILQKTTQQLRIARHRFPSARARQIVQSWASFAEVKEEFYTYLDTFDSERAARHAITKRFAGIGLKQASMFLRDIGYSDRLCVIDTHVSWYCSHILDIDPISLSPKRYLMLEDRLLDESDALGVSPAAYDAAIFAAVKTLKAKQCSTQFVLPLEG